MEELSSSRKIIRNSIANYGGFFFQFAIAFFLSPFLVHSLGDTQYGIWSIVAAFSGYMSLFDLGISSSLTRYVSKYNKTGETDKNNNVISSALGLYVIIAVLIIIVSPISANILTKLIKFDPSLNDTVNFLVIIVSFDVAFFLVAGTFRGVFQGLQQYDIINTILIISGAIKALLFFYFLSRGYGLLTMGLISFLEKAITIIIFVYILTKRYHLNINVKRITKTGVSCILGYSIFTFINMIANQLIYYTDSFVIGYFMDAAAVTYYSIAWSLIEYVKRFCTSFTRVFVPVISEYEALGNYTKIKNILISGAKYTLIVSCLFSLGLIIFGKAFINLWMGSEYGLVCGPVLIILVFSQFIELPQLISRAVLFGISKHKYMSFISITTAVVNLLLSILLISKFGIIGVALGTTIPQVFIYGLFMMIITNRIVSIPNITYIKEVYFPIIVPTIMFIMTGMLCLKLLYPANYFVLLCECFFCSLVFLIFSYQFSLNSDEKREVIRIVNGMLNRIQMVRF